MLLPQHYYDIKHTKISQEMHLQPKYSQHAHKRASIGFHQYLCWWVILSSSPAGVATDKDCVIVDDLVQTGGTLIECAKVKNPINTC